MTVPTRGRRRLVSACPVAAAGVTALVLSACGGSSSSSSASTTTQAPAATSSTGSTAASGSPGANTVTATETEYHIALSKSSLTPGTYTFVAKDAGQVSHTLVINGPGVKNKSTGTFSPGESASITVTLQRGSYEVYCNIPGHKESGMDTHVTVS